MAKKEKISGKLQYILLAVIASLLIFQSVIQFKLAQEDSQTIDEGAHIGAGYTYLTRGDFRFNPEHPPLLKFISALGVIAHTINVPFATTDWQRAGYFYFDANIQSGKWGHDLIYRSGNNADDILTWARTGPVLLTLLLGILIAVVSVRMWGWMAGAMATAFYVFDPLIAGHGHLVTTDVIASFGFLIALLSCWYFLKKPSWKSTLLFGVTLGIALLSKFTVLAVLPFIVAAFFIHLIKIKPSLKAGLLQFGQFCAVFIIAIGVIWVGYGFQDNTLPLTTGYDDYGIEYSKPYNGSLQYMYNNADVFSWIPLPYHYIKGALLVLGHAGFGHYAFLLGEMSITGWWYYFLVLIFTKTPLIVIGLLLTSIWILIRAKKTKKYTPSLPHMLAAGAGWFLIVGMFSKANIGLRHIMPLYPAMFLVGGYAFSLLSMRFKKIWLGLMGVVAIQFMFAYPFYLSYFNELAGGPYAGYKISTDSNLDWAQDIKRIKTYLDTHDLEELPYVVYYWDGEDALDYYGIQRRPTDQLITQPTGTVIIGASLLQTPERKWIMNRKLVDQITPGVLVYDLDRPR
ncbi:glycosyltransferase family 39 protein [Candidatus Gracilibacteria bacterium]|nr:glycosyltransferase family 39 protein [Candidatus Gracilibacteria bacterium]